MNAPILGCPINLTPEALGDRWSLIVIRDQMFGNRRHLRALLTRSEERIASNILADRLTRLEKAGLVFRRDDPDHRQKVIYSLTEASVAVVPLLAHTGGWGLRHTPASKELSIRAKSLRTEPPKLWSEFMEELRHLHSTCTPTSQEDRKPKWEDSPRGADCAAGIPPHALAHCHGTQNENQRVGLLA